MSWGPVSWLYLGEIFPTRIREFGIAIGAAAQWLFNFMLSQITPHAVNNLGWRTFLMFCIFNYALVAYAFFVLREVRSTFPYSKDIVNKLTTKTDLWQNSRRDGGGIWLQGDCGRP
jgi:hypothetical protein